MGIYLVIARSSPELFLIGIAGIIVSLAYTAPPLKLVYRGFGEIAVAVGFGPLMVLGAYVVQTETLSWEALVASFPVAILIALVLYINEIPDRKGDSLAGKRTLPVRWPMCFTWPTPCTCLERRWVTCSASSTPTACSTRAGHAC